MSVLELCDADVASVQVEVSAADAIRLMLTGMSAPWA